MSVSLRRPVCLSVGRGGEFMDARHSTPSSTERLVSSRSVFRGNRHATFGVSIWLALLAVFFGGANQSACGQALSRGVGKPAIHIDQGAPATPGDRSIAPGHILVAPNPTSAEADFQGALNAHG